MSILERLLRRLVGRHRADALLGDIHEEAAHAARPRRFWFTRQVLATMIAAAWVSADRKQARIRTSLAIALREAYRSVRRFPGSTALAFTVVAVSIAAATMTFSVVDAVVIRHLPFPEDDRLVAVGGAVPEDPYSRTASPPDYTAWRDRALSFESLAAWSTAMARLRFGSETENTGTAFTTPNLFDVLRVRPVLGRAYRTTEGNATSDAEVVIGYRLWQRRFGADPQVIGRTLSINGQPAAIVGVMPRGFGFPIEDVDRVEIWQPLVIPAHEQTITPESGRSSYLQVVGRLRETASLDQARAEVETISSEFASKYPVLYERWRVRVDRWSESLTEPFRGWMLLALAAVLLVLLLACANVANLLLARSVNRRRDLAVRVALGATRGQTVGLLLVESLLLACTAAAAAVAVAYVGAGVVRDLMPEGVARASDIAVDGRVLGISIVTTIVTWLLCGAVPAWQASRSEVIESLKRGGTPASAQSHRWRSGLLVAQTAVASALLVLTALVAGSFLRIQQTDLGFEPSNLLSVRIDPSFRGLQGEERQARIDERLGATMETLRSVPGVTRVAALGGGPLPLYNGGFRTFLESKDGPVTVEARSVSPDYFATAGIRLLRGRDFEASDRESTTPVVVIDELAARHLFGHEDPLGQSVRFAPGDMSAVVVGVTATVRLRGPEGDSAPQLYHPLAQRPADPEILVRTSLPAAQAIPSVSHLVLGLLPEGSPPPVVERLEDQYRRLTAARRLNAAIMGGFGLLALIIGVTGVYAVTASLVAQQTRELGIRMALGASSGRMIRALVGHTTRRLLAGTAVGLALAWPVTRLFESLLFDIQRSDLLPYVLPFALLTAAGMLAAFVPAVRASRIDPLVVLRRE